MSNQTDTSLAVAISALTHELYEWRQDRKNDNNKAILDRIAEMETKIMATQADIEAALEKVNVATNKLSDNVQVIADTDQQISDEIDAFLKNVPVGTVLTDVQVAALQATADKAQATSDASDAQVAVLKAIAAKGATNPVPVPVPPTPPTP